MLLTVWNMFKLSGVWSEAMDSTVSVGGGEVGAQSLKFNYIIFLISQHHAVMYVKCLSTAKYLFLLVISILSFFVVESCVLFVHYPNVSSIY